METDEIHKKETTEREIPIEPLYEGDLSIEDVQENPTLKPILEINKSYIETQKLINNSVWKLNEEKQAINQLLELNPKYSETILMGKVQMLMANVEQIKFLMESQQKMLIKAIQDMINNSKGQVGELSRLQEEIEGLLGQIEYKKTEAKNPEEQQEEAGK
ncbi:hypothetical protein LCGC14_1401350 [marine sediment metagenome]|uniref:Uncharacterized protein n=1 Tax=marine sediment metagenome TaxID=412755 RepID=A0A0F9JX16_9ZZZZ